MRPRRVPELVLGLVLVVALVAVGWLFATDERVRPLSWETAERVVLTVLVREQGGTCRDIGQLETARAALPAGVPTSAQFVDGAR